MARNKGQFTFAANFEVKAQAALDPRMVVATKAELFVKDTWPYDGETAYVYNGLVVAVTGEQALYMLIDKDNYTSESAWICLNAEAPEVIEIIDNLTSEDADKALSANQGKVLKDAVDAIGFSIKKLAVAEGDAVASYQLVGKDGTTVFGDTINIPKDLVVSSGTVKTATEEGVPYAEAKIGDVYIELVLANSETPLYIPANKLVDEYTAGDYISIVDRVISVDYEAVKAQIKTDLVDPVDNKVAAIELRLSGENGLEKAVAANDAAIKQIETNVGTLTTDVTNLDTRVGGVEQSVLANSNAVSSLNDKVAELEKALDAEEEGSVVQQITNITNVVADIKVKDVNTVANNGVALTIDENGVVSVVSNINAGTVKTTDVVGTMPAASTVQSVLENLDSRIKAAVSGGVTAIGAGFGISVDSSDVNNPSVAVKIKEGSALSVDADGLDIYWTTIE